MNPLSNVLNVIQGILVQDYKYAVSPGIFNFEFVPRSKVNAYRIEINNDAKVRELTGGYIEKKAEFAVWLLIRIPKANRQKAYITFMTDGIADIEKALYLNLKGEQFDIQGIQSLDLYDDYVVVRINCSLNYRRKVI